LSGCSLSNTLRILHLTHGIQWNVQTSPPVIINLIWLVSNLNPHFFSFLLLSKTKGKLALTLMFSGYLIYFRRVFLKVCLRILSLKSFPNTAASGICMDHLECMFPSHSSSRAVSPPHLIPSCVALSLLCPFLLCTSLQMTLSQEACEHVSTLLGNT
jgi:hypothetical protein